MILFIAHQLGMGVGEAASTGSSGVRRLDAFNREVSPFPQEVLEEDNTEIIAMVIMLLNSRE